MGKEKWFVKEEELDDFQYDITQLNPSYSYIIQGCAGSGKTILALWRAKQIQSSKRGSFYIIVFTKALRQFISDGIREIGIDTNRVVYEWDWEKRKGKPSADYIIVDEAQDFPESRIKEFVAKSGTSTMFFGDTAQQLYKNRGTSIGNIAHSTSFPIRELNYNYRLPKKIARVAQLIMTQRDELERRCKKEGTFKPIVKKCYSQDAELDFIVNRIKTRNLTDVAVLVPYNKQVYKIYNYFNSKGVNAQVKYNFDGDWLDTLDFSSNNPSITTYHSSKGLQFDTVFLPFCEVDDDFMRNALYVALTRASKNVIISYSNYLSPFFNAVPGNLLERI